MSVLSQKMVFGPTGLQAGRLFEAEGRGSYYTSNSCDPPSLEFKNAPDGLPADVLGTAPHFPS